MQGQFKIKGVGDPMIKGDLKVDGKVDLECSIKFRMSAALRLRAILNMRVRVILRSSLWVVLSTIYRASPSERQFEVKGNLK